MAENPIRKEDIIDAEGIIKSMLDIVGVIKSQLLPAIGSINKTITEEKEAVEKLNPVLKEHQTILAQKGTTINSLEQVQKKNKQTLTETERLEKRLNELRKDSAIQNEKLRQSIQKQTKENKNLVATEGMHEKSLAKLRIELSRLKAQYTKVSPEIAKKMAPAINKLNKSILESEKAIGVHQRNVGNYGTSFKKLGATILGAAGIYAGATTILRGFFNVIKHGFKTSWDFEYAMSQVKAIARATNEEFESLRQNAIALGGATKFTASEVAGLQKEYAKLGFTITEILEITEATLNLAAATGSDLAYAATIAGSTLRQFQLDATQMQRVVDVMALSFSTSALDMEKFATAMSNAGPVAKAVGETVESTTGKLAVLANAGLDASKSGTSLRNIFLELEMRGLTWDEAMTRINGSQNKASVSLELFGKRGAVAGLVLADNDEKIKEYNKSLLNADGASKEMADTMLDNVQGSATILKSAWEGLILRTNQSNGAMKGFLDTLTLVVSAINTKGKPAIDSLFDHRQIETYGDKFKFYKDQGVGFLNAIGMAAIRSKDTTQEFVDELAKSGDELKKQQDEKTAARLKKEQEEREAREAELKRIQAQVEAEEKLQEAQEDRMKAASKAIEKTITEDRKGMASWIESEGDKVKFAKEISNELVEIKHEEIQLTQAAIDANAEYDRQVNKEIAADKAEAFIEDANKYLEIASSLNNQLADIFRQRKEKELSAVGDNAEAREKIEREYANKEKIFAITTALIQNALNVMKALGTPPVPNIPLAAITGALGLVQIGLIASQKFAEGGEIEGRPHSRGGELIEAEGGEFMINKLSTSKYKGLIKAINEDDKMAIAEELRNRNFHLVWGGANEQLKSSARQDPYTRMMYELMRQNITTYIDSNGDTNLVYPNGYRRIIKTFRA